MLTSDLVKSFRIKPLDLLLSKVTFDNDLWLDIVKSPRLKNQTNCKVPVEKFPRLDQQVSSTFIGED